MESVEHPRGCGHDRCPGSREGDVSGAEAEGASRRELLTLGAAVLAGGGGYALQQLALRSGAPAELAAAGTALVVGAYLAAGWDVLWEAGGNLFRGKIFDELFLMSVASLGALAIGSREEALGVMVFYKIGEMLQEGAAARSRRSIRALLALRPDRARIRRQNQWMDGSPEELAPGDFFLVRPGERVPVDGVVTEGRGTCDTAALTGESLPHPLEPGAPIYAGTVVRDAAVVCRAEKVASQSSAARILDLVERAAASKARTERFLTRFARWYTPAVVGSAALIAVGPPLLMPGEQFEVWAYRALVLLVISCPCALMVSVPLGYFAGLGGAARRGILVKGAAVLDALADARTVVFDKTGTLTDGAFRVRSVEPAEGFTEENLLEGAAAAGTHSNHPLARAVRRAWQELGQETLPCEDGSYEEIPGHGTVARVGGQEILAGSHALLHLKEIPHECRESDGTVIHVAVAGRYAGRIEVGDAVKPDGAAALATLRRMGIHRVVLLTGDGEAPAQRVGAQVGIGEIHAKLLPEDKLARLETILEEERRRGAGSVVFVGDGVNDAPVLARADAGIAMGGAGSDAAVESADVVLLTDEPSRVAEAISRAVHTRRIVRENIVVVLLVKGIFLGMGSLGWATMWEAVGADVGMALLAVLNASRALR